MSTCKQVSRALEEKDYTQLTGFSRLMMRFHIALCIVCGKYNKQRMIMHDFARGFLEHEEDGSAASEEGLGDEGKERLRASFARRDQVVGNGPLVATCLAVAGVKKLHLRNPRTIRQAQ